MITEWLRHPVSKGFLKIINELLHSNKEDLIGRIINGPSLGVQDLHQSSQLRGQILALEEVLKTKEFLVELLVEEELNK